MVCRNGGQLGGCAAQSARFGHRRFGARRYALGDGATGKSRILYLARLRCLSSAEPCQSTLLSSAAGLLSRPCLVSAGNPDSPKLAWPADSPFTRAPALGNTGVDRRCSLGALRQPVYAA